jgi:hypothetical protein
MDPGLYPPHARVYENEGQPEWQLDFALSFDLTQALRREEDARCHFSTRTYVAFVAAV